MMILRVHASHCSLDNWAYHMSHDGRLSFRSHNRPRAGYFSESGFDDESGFTSRWLWRIRTQSWGLSS